MIATTSWLAAMGAAIPLVIVFGIFVVSPLTQRKRGHAWVAGSSEQARKVEDTQTQILEEVRALRAQLDEVQRVLAAVE